jgi:predicted DCC family thiol-disulfide oxidoreductase YuxK
MNETARKEEKRPVLIYDGNCPICRKTIGWIGENSRPETFEFLTCQSEAIGERFPAIDRERCMQAMQLVLPDGTVLPAEQALPEIFRRMQKYRAVANLFRLPGAAPFSGAFYRWFADHRYEIAKVFLPREVAKTRK